MICPHCHQEHPDAAVYCPVTGRAISQPAPGTRSSVPARRSQYLKLGIGLALLLAFGAVILCVVVYLVFFRQAGLLSSLGIGTNQTEQVEQAAQTQAESLASAPTTLEAQGKDVPTAVPKPSDTPKPTETPLPTATPLPTHTPTVTFTPTPVNQPLALQVNEADGAEIVLVPAGEFLMGSDASVDPYFYGAEGPQHLVTLDEFWIYRTEVTNAMYAACVAASACPRPAYTASATRDEYYGSPDFAAYPVVYVSWTHAASYCAWAGGRLPTEAEWEKAGRGMDARLFPWGDDLPTSQLVHFNTRDTAAVGSYPLGASPFGAFDMSGNVHEWVFDWFQATYYSISPDENPLGAASGTTRVYRGGAYHNQADGLRVVMRGSRAVDFNGPDIGFRCVIELP